MQDKLLFLGIKLEALERQGNVLNTTAEVSRQYGLPWWLSVKNLPTNAGDAGLIPGSRRSPGKGNGNPLQYSCLGNPMDRRNLADYYSPWGGKGVQCNLVTERQVDNIIAKTLEKIIKIYKVSILCFINALHSYIILKEKKMKIRVFCNKGKISY